VCPRGSKRFDCRRTMERRMMKVVLVGPYSLPHGGVRVHVVQLKRFLERRGHACFVINLGKHKDLQSLNVVSPKNVFQVALSLLRKRDYICHLHFGGTLHTKLLLLALFCNLMFYKRCAITIHSGGLPDQGMPENPMKRLLSRLS